MPCAIQYDLVVYPFYIYQFASANPKLPVLPHPLPFGNHKSVLYVGDRFLASLANKQNT